MANRTFKQFGAGYDSAGSMNVVLTIGGSEVYNGAVTVGTENIYGTDLSESELFSFQLDDSVSGDVAWQISVTGTDHTSKLWLGEMSSNLIRPTETVTWETQVALIATHGAGAIPLSDQQNYANSIGQTRLDAQKAGLYDLLQAGNTTAADHGYYVVAANEDAGTKQEGAYFPITRTLSNGVRDGEAYDVSTSGSWPLIKSG